MNLIRVAYAVQCACTDFTDMLQRFINCHFIIISVIVSQYNHYNDDSTHLSDNKVMSVKMAVVRDYKGHCQTPLPI